jgi:hypothetical protein
MSGHLQLPDKYDKKNTYSSDYVDSKIKITKLLKL